MKYLMKTMKLVIITCIGISLMIVCRDAYWFFYSEVENTGYQSLQEENVNQKISGSFGKVREEVVLDQSLDTQRIFQITFTPYGTPFPVYATYPLDTYEGDSLIRIEGPGSIQYTESSDSNTLSIINTFDDFNQQYTHSYYDYNRDGRVDCISREEIGKDVQVWILSGKSMIPVDTLPLISEDGSMQVSDGSILYRLTGAHWQKKNE